MLVLGAWQGNVFDGACDCAGKADGGMRCAAVCRYVPLCVSCSLRSNAMQAMPGLAGDGQEWLEEEEAWRSEAEYMPSYAVQLTSFLGSRRPSGSRAAEGNLLLLLVHVLEHAKRGRFKS